MYDVIVVGARCAGSTTALLYARAGLRVLLLDRARFPSDTLSTLYIQQPGVARLARWGVLDDLTATGCPTLDRVVYQLDDIRVEGCAAPVEGITGAIAPRRHTLDRILAEHAVAAGAELRTGCQVTGLIEEDGRVVGVTCKEGGRSVTERAPLVVGADGMRSTVARFVRAAEYHEAPRLTCAYYTFWAGLQTDFELYEGKSGWVSAVPTNDGAVLVSAYFPQDRFEEVRADALASYTEGVRINAPQIYEQVKDAERLERLRGTGEQRNYFRRAAGPGWVLVGDAGHHKDSLTARGIGDAFLQSELLVELTAGVLHDPERLASALAVYGTRRDEQLMEAYQGALMVASAEGKDKRRALLSALRTSPDLTQRYFDTVAGLRPVADLYTPELLALMSAR
ncbi:NAD(P)/FAD-dependent oxidoreductase [Streptomyces sp. NBC_00441]|uniref:NAD(P)/FAD-dependent oxidoreductase n=1 Tax=Streptomyces sp. NBC_00441 TaxID=2975742 RepID=UPI002E2CB40F|nr:NAD(P)/FAD-dependent oxidoreductase [Streptomyces sp. NBC_00441]